MASSSITYRRVLSTPSDDGGAAPRTALINDIAGVIYRYKESVRNMWIAADVQRDSSTQTTSSDLSSNAKISEKTKRSKSPCLKTISRGVTAVLNNEDLGYIFVAEETREEGTGHVVGVAVIHREVSDWRAGFVWYINTIAVDPKRFFVGLPPFSSIGNVDDSLVPAAPTELNEAKVNAACTNADAALVTIGLVEAVRSAVNNDETAKGFRIYVEDPFDIMQRPFYKKKGQHISEADGLSSETNVRHVSCADSSYRGDSSAVHVHLLCDPIDVVSTCSEADEGNATTNAFAHTGSADEGSKTLHREHYFMMTWFK